MTRVVGSFGDRPLVQRLRRDEAGLLWLRAGVESHGEGESLRLQVFRAIRQVFLRLFDV